MPQTNRHRLIDYMNYRGLDNGGLIPEPQMLGPVVTEEWCVELMENLNQIIWMHYYDRQVLVNEKFPYNAWDPDNTDNMDKTTDDILFTFAYHLKSNAQKYRLMYKTYKEEFEPFYNVDAHEFEDRTLSQTGTDTTAASGDDTAVRSGNQELEKLGQEATTRTGNEALSHTGTDTVETDRTTYDDSTFLGNEKVTTTPGATDTTTYNSVADTTAFTGRKDKTTYNNVQDKTTYGRVDTNSKDLHDVEHIERRRYGNIGVTKATDLGADAFRYADEYLDLMKKICHDLVNTCTYMVE